MLNPEQVLKLKTFIMRRMVFKYARIKKLYLLVIIGCLIITNGYGQEKIDNPVLPGVADAGVMKFNGRYYIGGVFTRGDFYVSDDLAHWKGPVHVFSMNNEWATKFGIGNEQIHANDMHYINGTFHLYWSVNSWGRERNVVHIAHATSENPLGPYVEPIKDTWLDNRIDPHLFVDDDGKLYLYMVKFTDGNTIWARPMKDPYSFEGEPKYIFASQPGNWETLDNRVIEGPWVIKYRDRYYMMYNTNHTSTEWGNYALGIAEASGPLDFNHGNKYAHPVVGSNQLDLEDLFVDLLKYQEQGAFLYSMESINREWYQPDFDASSWQKGRPGFGSRIVENSTTKKVKTGWNSDACLLRKRFTYNKNKNGNLSMRILHDGAAKAYLNGTLIYDTDRGNYIHVDLRDKKHLLKDGDNLLAIEGHKGQRSNYLDVALFDMKDQVADDILYTPGQPNILRGPNGFEWWLIYMANKNREPRSQYINRVHFFDKKLTVDGITGKNTPGYHPVPVKPTYQYLSDNNQSLPTINQTIPGIPATHYFFEAGMKPAGTACGIIAWKADENNWLKIYLDGAAKTWFYVLQENGQQQKASFPLAADFRPDVFHSLSVYKNDTDFDVRIDDLPAPAKSLIRTNFTGKGLPGICADDSNVVFDGITYTIGWDECDNRKGWKTNTGFPAESPRQSAVSEFLLKGDLTDYYEMSVQIEAGTEKGFAGAFPIYINQDSYVKTAFDFSEQRLIISGKNKGKAIETQQIALSGLKPLYTNMVFSDNMERHFTFDAPTTLDAILFKKNAVNRSDTLIENIHEKFHLYYVKDSHWEELRDFRHVAWEHPGMSRIEFSPIETTELIFVDKKMETAEIRDLSLQKIWVNELFKQSYNLRVVKTKDKILFFVDGKMRYQMPNTYASSQVGLFSDGMKAGFNGITVFHLPE